MILLLLQVLFYLEKVQLAQITWDKVILLLFLHLFILRGDRREKEMERDNNVWLPLMRPLL